MKKFYYLICGLIASVFFWGKASAAPTISKLLPFTNSDTAANAQLSDVQTLIANITSLALGLAGAVAVIYLIIGAINYFTAFGNEEKATKAKTTITWAIIGVVVIVLSTVIVNEITNFIH
jgi:uncharacterized membrane protein YidH (DUF202 family)